MWLVKNSALLTVYGTLMNSDRTQKEKQVPAELSGGARGNQWKNTGKMLTGELGQNTDYKEKLKAYFKGKKFSIINNNRMLSV